MRTSEQTEALRKIAFAVSKMNELALDQTEVDKAKGDMQAMYSALRETSIFAQCTMINVNLEILGWEDVRTVVRDFLESKDYSQKSLHSLLDNMAPLIVSRLGTKDSGYLETIGGFNFWFMVHPKIRGIVVRGFANRDYYRMLIEVFEFLYHCTGTYINIDELFQGKLTEIEAHQLLVIASYELGVKTKKRSIVSSTKTARNGLVN